MKLQKFFVKLSLVLTFLSGSALPFAAFAALPTLNDYVNTNAVNTNDVQNTENAVNNAQKEVTEAATDLSNIEARKEAIVASIDAALTAITGKDNTIQDAENFNEEQKDVLLGCSEKTQTNLKKYKSDVQKAENQSQLLDAHEAYANTVVANSTAIKTCALQSVAIGVAWMLDVSIKFVQVSEDFYDTLPTACKEEVAEDAERLFPESYALHKQLTDKYDAVTAGGVTADEQAEVEELITLSVEYSIYLVSVYAFDATVSSLCGVPFPA